MKSFIKLFNEFFNRKSIIILTLVTVSIGISSCGSDDEPEVIENTFLKQFNGEKWEVELDDINYAFKFNDDINNPFSYWQEQEEEGCYFFFDPYNLEFDILEQTNDKFAVIFKFISGNRYQIIQWTFTVDDKGIIHANTIPLTKTDKIYLRCSGN